MGALTIAFDTTIVGALALPWLVLVVHLFFLGGEGSIKVLLRWVRRLNQPAVVSVVLFAMTYSLGSAVSRIAQDFFNDDDLNLQFPSHPPLLIRVGVTEYRILASVYCQNAALLHVAGDSPNQPTAGPTVVSPAAASSALAGPATTSPAVANSGNGTNILTQEIVSFRPNALPPDFVCQHILSWALLVPQDTTDNGNTEYEEDNSRYNAAAVIFGLQENALMEKGADYTVRLRQLHDQVMVLRGASFNGVLAFSLCLFAWGGQVRCQKPRSALRWTLALAPGIYLALTLIALLHHLFERGLSEPPFMEYTLLLLGLAGAWLVWKRPPERTPRHSAESHDAHVGADTFSASSGQALVRPGESETRPVLAEHFAAAHASRPHVETSKGKEKKYCWQTEPWRRYVALSAILTGAAIFGWWSTEVFYAEQVIYSYNSQGPSAGQK